MANQTEAVNRKTELGLGQPHRGEAPALAATAYYRGAVIGVDSAGRALKAGTDAAVFAVGVVSRNVDNSAGSNDDLMVPYEYRLYSWFDHDGLTVADLKKPVYFEDDQTVVSDPEDNSDHNTLGGILHKLDGDQALVEIIGHHFLTLNDIPAG